MSGHDPVSSGNALTTHSPHSPSVAPSGTMQNGLVGKRQSASVVHGFSCPSTGETMSSVTVDTAKRNAPRLAPLLCSERISPLLCRCFFSSSKGEGGAAESTSAFGLHLKRRSSKPFAGDRRAPPWLGSRCAPRTASTHSLRYSMPPPSHITPAGRMFSMSVISLFTFRISLLETTRVES